MTIAEEFAALRLAQHSSGAAAAQFIQLHHLPPDALARIMELLSIEDIMRLREASRGLRLALQDDRVWHGLCLATWGAKTEPHRWLAAPALAGPSTRNRAGLPVPTTYRQLYTLLHAAAPLVGLWRLVGEGPRSSLISFRWVPGGIEGVEVEPCAPLTGRAEASAWAYICPARTLPTSVAVDDVSGQATVTMYSCQELRIPRSPSAEAAAAVALPHSQASPCALGTSPPGSFEQEWLQFMAGNVARSSRSKQRRRCQRGLGQATARPEGPTIYHLKRLPELPLPSRKHPYSGLWAADYGPQGLEVLQLHYDFRGRMTQLRAVKVTGDECVPAGQCSWHCSAATLPMPWGAADQALVEQQERWLQERQWWDEWEEEGEGEGSGDQEHVGGSSNTDAKAAAGVGPASKAPPRVVAIHDGSGQVAGPGFVHPEWVAGRLLAFDNGRLCFAWLEGLQQVTHMQRLRMDRLAS